MSVRRQAWILAAVAGLAGCRTADQQPVEPAQGVAFVDVLDLARELGMAAQRDTVTQGLILSDGVNQIVVSPGTSQALVNGRFVSLGLPAQFHQGRLVMPAQAVKPVTAALKPRPARGRRG